MPGAPSSKGNPSKLSSFHIVVSSFAALAGVAIAGWQALAPSSAPAPVNVTVAIDPASTNPAAKPGDSGGAASKADAEASVALDGASTYSAALNDGSDKRYQFADLFDGKPETAVALAAPDSEINVMVTFPPGAPANITGFEYLPPPNADPGKFATTADVMVLPEGQLGAAGRPVASFTLSGTERQSFSLPEPQSGKGLWLRVAGGSLVGDFKILKGP